jgi:hypothetical protein
MAETWSPASAMCFDTDWLAWRKWLRSTSMGRGLALDAICLFATSAPLHIRPRCGDMELATETDLARDFRSAFGIVRGSHRIVARKALPLFPGRHVVQCLQMAL